METQKSQAQETGGEMMENIGQLIAALAKAQAKFDTPIKNKVAKVRSEKGSYEYRYSDLADLIAAVRAPLSENELAFSHCLVPNERGTVVCTILAHSSGEMLKSEYLVPQFQRQQEFGSALTYAKRYCLSSLLGVAADDDDDGNLADDQPPQSSPRPPLRQTGATPPPPQPPPGVTTQRVSTESAAATAARQRVRMLIDNYQQKILRAPHAHALENVATDGAAELEEIEASGTAGEAAARELRRKFEIRMKEFEDART
jgi:hypothetical protein